MAGLSRNSIYIQWRFFYSKRSPDDNAHEINAAILVKIPNGVVIAFRGTEPDKSDWLNNFKLFIFHDLDQGTRELLYEKGRHAGFERSLQSLRSKILQNPTIWQPFANQAEGTLYLTGHSKGGALATGATVDFRQSDFSGDVVTYTFARGFLPLMENKLMKLSCLEYLKIYGVLSINMTLFRMCRWGR